MEFYKYGILVQELFFSLLTIVEEFKIELSFKNLIKLTAIIEVDPLSPMV